MNWHDGLINELARNWGTQRIIFIIAEVVDIKLTRLGVGNARLAHERRDFRCVLMDVPW